MIPLRPSAQFAWRETPAGPALVCVALDAHVSHLFTTRPWHLGRGRNPADAWRQIAEALGPPAMPLVRLRQVHGVNVVVGDDAPFDRAEPEGPPEGDIVVASAARHHAVAVQAADCIPLLLADPRSGAVAAAHAGWRGLALGVPSAAVLALERQYGARRADLVVALGPAIGACCYEVGDEVRAAFAAAGFTDVQLRRWFLPAPAPCTDHPSERALVHHAREGRWYFDGPRAAREQLAMAGVPSSHVHGADLCTAGHSDVLCSYRRDGAAAGRMAAVVTTRFRARSPVPPAG